MLGSTLFTTSDGGGQVSHPVVHTFINRKGDLIPDMRWVGVPDPKEYALIR